MLAMKEAESRRRADSVCAKEGVGQFGSLSQTLISMRKKSIPLTNADVLNTLFNAPRNNSSHFLFTSSYSNPPHSFPK